MDADSPPGRRSRPALAGQHQIQWRHNKVTFMPAFDTPVAHYLGLVEEVGFAGGTGCHNRPATLIIRNPVDLERVSPPKGWSVPRRRLGLPGLRESLPWGFNGAVGPVPWRNLRTALSALWARAAIYPSPSTRHNPRSRDLSQPGLSRDGRVPSETILWPFCARRYATVWFRSLALRCSG